MEALGFALFLNLRWVFFAPRSFGRSWRKTWDAVLRGWNGEVDEPPRAPWTSAPPPPSRPTTPKPDPSSD